MINSKERGVVSLIVTLVMMIVITLLVLGFAEVARNEQRSSLDDQLSAQAYYAAESGINDARAVINKAIATGGPGSVQSKGVCGNQGSYVLDPVINVARDVSYTCVRVDATPKTLTKTVGYESSVLPLTSAGGTFSKLTLNWTSPSDKTAKGCYSNLASLNKNPVNSAWTCNYPVLRVDLVNGMGGFSRANWSSATSTMFFVPFDASKIAVANSVAWGMKGKAVPASCSSAACVAEITGLSGTDYYMRVTTLYRTGSNLTIDGNGISFKGAQATIDSTGKAQDVLRRVLVAVDLTDANAYAVPGAAIVARDSVCKRFSVTNGSFQVYNDITIVGANGNTYCTVQSLGTPSP
ncbi:MAG TPA: pilus assembly PilX N-terminal domain-containing protein [Verrucomicrobiae bacterium]|nr:pilus assembly PilX N-terminal domain-containing protein [Verrucomicrobiae bacterium]